MQDLEFTETLEIFEGKSFSTLQFANAFSDKFPSTWNSIVEKYGKGGKGSGKHYSAYSRIAHYLNKRFNNDELDKLDYRSAPAEWGSPVIRYWAEDKSICGAQNFPDEISEPDKIIEGAKKTVVVNRYERSATARTICIEKWGIKCFVCQFDFEETYGSIGAGFIHVHHLKPISEIGEEYELNPEEDLRPLCPNCHAMAHREVPAISIENLKERFE